MRKKCLFGIILSLAMLLGLTAQSVADTDVAATEVVVDEKGDTDKNGQLSYRDALKALLYAAKVETPATDEDIYRANVDGDDAIDVEDAKTIFNAVIEGKDFGYKYVGEDENVILVSSNSICWEGVNCYTSLADAVKYVNANAPASEEERITVLFAPGVYREHTTLTAPYITYRAMFPESEVPANITYYYGCGVAYNSLGGTSATADTDEASTIINKSAHDFIAEDMMFENSYNIYVTEEELTDYCGYPSDNYPITIRQDDNQIRVSKYQTQALAIKVDADRCQFYNCDIISRQDTLLMNGNGNRVYYENCYIEGTVDFIYGNGTAVFESCTINSPYHSGHITAGSHTSDIEYGFLFKDCELTRTATTPSVAPEDASYSLGRPWHNQPMVFYWNCKMDNHIYKGIEGYDVFDENTGDLLGFQITDGRWRPMGDGNFITSDNSRFAEVGTMDIEGNPIDLTEACPEFEMILEQADMQPGGEYAAYKWLYGSDQWNPGGYPVE